MLEFLLAKLADGAFHSGEKLAGELGVTRAAVCKRIAELQRLGLVVHSVRGKGYRIPDGLDLLDSEVIRTDLGADALKRFGVPSIHLQVDSTNALAMDKIHGCEKFSCLAESQRAGRGRLGRNWESPFAANIYLSLIYRQDNGVHGFEGLSLVVGLACAEAIRGLGVSGIQLKWPNDLLVGQRKLGGILLEIGGDLSGEAAAVIGIGINVHMREEQGRGIDQPWVSLDQLGGRWTRNQLVVAVMNCLAARLDAFELSGFGGLREAWAEFDSCSDGLAVTLSSGAGIHTGEYAGVTETGGVRIRTASGVQDYFGGEISLRGMSG